ncbi:MAG TPA: DUF4191 domain-containing protein [Nocardioidaceae bacterium]|jgi:hypothetical protein|nr:DUF4191 domain-containing protein [Nocardioidaceae bacterium]
MAKTPTPEKTGRLKQIGAAYTMTKKSDRKIGLILAGTFLVVFAVFGALGWWLLHWVFGIVLGLFTGWAATMVVFARRAERAAYGQMEGKPGAAAASLGLLKRGWKVQPGIAFTKNQDVLHRVVGRPGIVLIGEGNPNRVRNLLAVEKRKHARVAGDAPIYDVLAGDGSDGTVANKRLARHILKLPRNLRPNEVTDLLQRLKALDASRPQVPIPKGPVPQNARAARSMMRGR